MSLADVYVLLDVVQFTKNNWQNRNRLVDRDGHEFWATVPVVMKGHLSGTIREMLIDNSQDWRRKYWGRIEQAYCRHPHFGAYGSTLREIVMRPCDRLVDLNTALIAFFREALGIRTAIRMASDLGVSGKKSDLLLAICQAIKADTYLSGPSGRDYLNRTTFKQAGIAIDFHCFHAPVYDALHYLPCLSTLDILFNHGPHAGAIIGLGRPLPPAGPDEAAAHAGDVSP